MAAGKKKPGKVENASKIDPCKTALPGEAFTLKAYSDRDKCPLLEWLEGLPDDERAKLWSLFEQFANKGEIRNNEKFSRLRDGLWEFKHFQSRVPCFYAPGKVLILTHGFQKKKEKAPSAEVERALRYMKDHEENHV